MRRTYKAVEWAAVCNRLKLIFAWWLNVELGGSKNKNHDLVECMGSSRDASRMVIVVSYPNLTVTID